jgi:predicted nucleic acid-binding protein
VKAYLDTNVLVAAAVREHPHHVPCFDLIRRVKDKKLRGCVGTHGLAEFYSVLTRAPFNPRVHPAEVQRLLEENLLPYFELVSLAADDYLAALSDCAKAGLVGGIVFDALHLRSAQKSACDRIYTLNLKDFRSLATSDQVDRIAAP